MCPIDREAPIKKPSVIDKRRCWQTTVQRCYMLLRVSSSILTFNAQPLWKQEIVWFPKRRSLGQGLYHWSQKTITDCKLRNGDSLYWQSWTRAAATEIILDKLIATKVSVGHPSSYFLPNWPNSPNVIATLNLG